MDIYERIDNLYEWIDDQNLLGMTSPEYYKMTKEVLKVLDGIMKELEG